MQHSTAQHSNSPTPNENANANANNNTHRKPLFIFQCTLIYSQPLFLSLHSPLANFILSFSLLICNILFLRLLLFEWTKKYYINMCNIQSTHSQIQTQKWQTWIIQPKLLNWGTFHVKKVHENEWRNCFYLLWLLNKFNDFLCIHFLYFGISLRLFPC